MKLQYLAQVQKLLEQYDFPDKYRILLELEEQLTTLEQNGKLSKEDVFNKIGSPAEYASRVIEQYDVPKNSTQEKPTSIIEDTDQLLSVTHTDLEAGTSTVLIDQTMKMEAIKRVEEANDPRNHKSSIFYHEHTHQKEDPHKKQKRPFKILFGLLLTLFSILAFLIISATIVVAVGILVLVDIQTGISLLLGMIFAVIAVGLFLSALKQTVYSIIEKNLKTIRYLLKLIFMLLFAILSKIMLSSSLETLGMYVANNIDTAQLLFASYNIDISNIDWTNLQVSDIFNLFKDIINSVL